MYTYYIVTNKNKNIFIKPILKDIVNKYNKGFSKNIK